MIDMDKMSRDLLAAFGAVILTTTAVAAAIGPVQGATVSGPAAPAGLAAASLSSQA